MYASRNILVTLASTLRHAKHRLRRSKNNRLHLVALLLHKFAFSVGGGFIKQPPPDLALAPLDTIVFGLHIKTHYKKTVLRSETRSGYDLVVDHFADLVSPNE
ncbi:unnamed protein product [Arctia plantaginis]|uniref:Uncharacterized protein n=1 Tax=Arctia plantaginis TaxID=874455 RepID=A0A8S1AW56_ARCPL|nr:unnamed protein product [Arctia plantaginis]